MAYWTFDTLDNLVLMEGAEQKCFRALIPGQVEIYVETYILQTSMNHFHFEFSPMKPDFFIFQKNIEAKY